MTDKQMQTMHDMWKTYKAGNDDTLLLFKLGEHYEAFYTDAVQIKRYCEVLYHHGRAVMLKEDIEPLTARMELMGFKIKIIEEANP